MHVGGGGGGRGGSCYCKVVGRVLMTQDFYINKKRNFIKNSGRVGEGAGAACTPHGSPKSEHDFQCLVKVSVKCT